MNVRRPLIAGNWKMNGLGDDGMVLALKIADKMKAHQGGICDVLVCPPHTLIYQVGQAVADSGVALGGQNCHHAEKGAHTGDVSAPMLADIGCSYVIVGHSERRAAHDETDAQVRSKAQSIHAAGLVSIVCVGETEVERDSEKTLDVIKKQLSGSLADGCSAVNTVVAYEPVWAIGTGRTPTNEQVQQVHAFIRVELSSRFGEVEAQGMRILYGGSMNAVNAANLLALDDVDGGLIGGASLKADDFWAITQSCP